jgi:hypothetical protein
VQGSAAHSGSFGVNAGPQGTIGTLTQDIPTIPGEHYNIHFWLQGADATPNLFQVDWDGVTVFQLVDHGGFGYTEFVIDPQASDVFTTLTLSFRNDPSFDQFDDISVRQTAAVPGPASLVLLGMGFAGIAPLIGMRRRRAA